MTEILSKAFEILSKTYGFSENLWRLKAKPVKYNWFNFVYE